MTGHIKVQDIALMVQTLLLRPVFGRGQSRLDRFGDLLTKQRIHVIL